MEDTFFDNEENMSYDKNQTITLMLCPDSILLPMSNRAKEMQKIIEHNSVFFSNILSNLSKDIRENLEMLWTMIDRDCMDDLQYSSTFSKCFKQGNHAIFHDINVYLMKLSVSQFSYLHSSLSQIPSIRPDSRNPIQFRPLFAQVNILPLAYGSSYVKWDDTSVVVSIKADIIDSQDLKTSGKYQKGGKISVISLHLKGQ
ncbi:hypothetical protein PCK1_001816, partial [Pneumocystis canis]